jgi:hypothetical protein
MNQQYANREIEHCIEIARKPGGLNTARVRLTELFAVIEANARREAFDKAREVIVRGGELAMPRGELAHGGFALALLTELERLCDADKEGGV